eukprot:s2132_g4.t1
MLDSLATCLPFVLPVLRSYASHGIKIAFVWPRTLERLVPAPLADPLTFGGAAVACSQHRNFVTCHAPTSLWRSEGDRDPVWRDQQQQTLFAGYPVTVSAELGDGVDSWDSVRGVSDGLVATVFRSKDLSGRKLRSSHDDRFL